MIVAASYVHTQNTSLTKPRIYRALKEVIWNKHPQLALTYFRRPSERDNDKHRCWKGYLKEINPVNCVSFVEGTFIDDKSLGPIVEKLHQLWFHQASLEHEQTLWRLVVVNGVHAIFVYEHTIRDGRSGLLFYTSLMDGLNSMGNAENADQQSAVGSICVLRVQFDKPCLDPMDFVTHKPSILYILYMMILFHIIRLIFRGERLLFSDMNIPEQSFNYRDSRHIINPSTTQLQCLRLNAKKVKTCLMLYRKHDVKFTAFLNCLVKIGLTVDLYPLAKVSFGSISIDLRTRDIISKDFKRMIGNASSALWDITWTSEFRKEAKVETRTENEDKYSIHIPYS